MEPILGLDFETYGAVDLPKHGLHNYINDDTFRPLIGHVAYEHGNDVFDFVEDMKTATAQLKFLLKSSEYLIAAHNAPFEKAVLDWLGIVLPWDRFIDTAVLARAYGYGSKLEAAAPQALGVDKMAEGWPLIKLFSMPGKFQEATGSLHFDPDIVVAHPDEWRTFNDYCLLDAQLSRGLARQLLDEQFTSEREFNRLTNEMNQVGWTVDLDSVRQMQQRYEENLRRDLAWFYQKYQPNHTEKERLNFNSFKQLKEWCADRGVKARSFDELHVKKMLAAIDKRLGSTTLTPAKKDDLYDVRIMLLLKQDLGGSSLKKLQAILDQTSSDGQLRDQYLHIGAGQTWRTSGRGVQMQNLKRLSSDLLDMELLSDDTETITNQALASNLRQCFTASHPDGQLIVGDLSSVESRGLAWLADAQWKTKAFFNSLDMYKVLAAKMFTVDYNDVLKSQRQTGKVGELSCGYGAGGGAVKDFAEKMGTILTEVEANNLVSDWRDTNPEVVDFWARLDYLLHDVVENGRATTQTHCGPDGSYDIWVQKILTPASLVKQHPGAQSIQVQVCRPDGTAILTRVFHGCYMKGRNIVYHKPSERKQGSLWKDSYVHPKTKQVTDYTIYGGKLAGILTQSLCRQLFFAGLSKLDQDLKNTGVTNVKIIGQFHDEIVLDWRPQETGSDLSLDSAKVLLYNSMRSCSLIKFPMDAEVKSDYRYTK